MLNCDTLIRNARVLDGSGAAAELLDVAIREGRICDIGPSLRYWPRSKLMDANGLALAPGFIDVHTHDDTAVIRTPQMLAEAFARRHHGDRRQLRHQRLAGAAQRRTARPDEPARRCGVFAIRPSPPMSRRSDEAQPAVNVGALVGHTALRNNHMDRLDRAATLPRSKPCARNCRKLSIAARSA